MNTLSRRAAALILLAVIVPVSVASALVLFHVGWVTLPDYWYVPYRRLEFFPLYPMCCLAALPTLAGVWLIGPRPVTAVLLAMLTAAGLMFSASLCATHPPGLTAIHGVVLDPVQSTYLADAVRLDKDISAGRLNLSHFIADYPKFMVNLGIHTRIRGPGWILAYIGLLQLTGGDAESAAMLGAMLLALMATAAVPATAWMIRRLGGSREQAVCGALLQSVLPAMVLFFPLVDPGYCTVTAGLIGLWAVALDGTPRRSAVAAAATGLLLGISCIFTFNFLVLGIFMLALTLRALWKPEHRRQTLIACGIAFASAILLFLFLRLTTRFDIVSTFRQSLANEHEFQTTTGRARNYSVLLDIYDHAFGSAFALHALLIVWIILLFDRLRAVRPRSIGPAAFIGGAALLQYLVLALTGRMPVETTRIWLFLTPLLLFPAAEVMAALGRRRQLILVGVIALAVPVYAQNLYLVTWMKSQRTTTAAAPAKLP